MRRMTLRVFIIGGRRFVLDVLLCGLAFLCVAALPLQTHLPFQPNSVPLYLAGYTLFSAMSLAAFRTYRMIWRYVSFQDLLTLVKASTLTQIGFLGFQLLLAYQQPPNSVVMLFWTVALLWVGNIGFLAAPRLFMRALREFHILDGQIPVDTAEFVPVLVSGDVERIEDFIRECERDSASRYRPVGALVNDTRLHGRYLHGVLVLGNVEGLERALFLSEKRGPRPQLLVHADDSASRQEFERLLELTTRCGLKFCRLRRRGSFHSGTGIEPVAIADLLGRPEVVVDTSTVAQMIEGKCILVTGAGGSIGGELARQIARLKPAKLIVSDASEFGLYSIDKEIEETFPLLPRQALLLDVRDASRVTHWIQTCSPDIVFHAAALKHVPLLEEHPTEAIMTNILGTINVADACFANGVRAMVTISTDKAVNPCNVMGATKRLSEAYCQAMDRLTDNPNATRFMTVRFGNVLGSTGSVVPLFQRQIEAGGPVTVTHEEINRYFMTIGEAVTLVLQAGAQGINLDKERGSIYVLDMGEPVKIIDLARKMIKLAGHVPDVDIMIDVVGLRPGEKLYEEIAHHDELPLPTKCKSIMRLKPRFTDQRIIRHQVQELRQACTALDRVRALRVLRVSVPEFHEDARPAQPLRQR